MSEWRRYDGGSLGTDPTPNRSRLLDTWTAGPVVGLTRPRTRGRYRDRTITNGTPDAWSSWTDFDEPNVGAAGVSSVQNITGFVITSETEVEIYNIGQPWRITPGYEDTDATTSAKTYSVGTPRVFMPGSTHSFSNAAPANSFRDFSTPPGVLGTGVMVDIPAPDN
jgi:hypothetical protein